MPVDDAQRARMFDNDLAAVEAQARLKLKQMEEEEKERKDENS